MKKIILLLLASSVFIFTGCVKTGPPGPQGSQGPQGPQGNANVIGSDPFTVSSWSKTGNTYYADFSSPDITTAIVDNGIVSVFKSYGANEWSPLPDISGKTSTVFNFYDNGFSIYVQNSDGTEPLFPGAVTFRMVVISSSLRQANPNTDWNNYKETMAAIHNANVANSSVQ
ncbi:MAG: collagen-like protein [Taibaiella sp.]|nr:collagen-like protein [Taibaiella sp.]